MTLKYYLMLIVSLFLRWLSWFYYLQYLWVLVSEGLFSQISSRICEQYIPVCRARSGSLEMPWQKKFELTLGVGLNKLWRHPLLTLFSIIFTSRRGREMSDRAWQAERKKRNKWLTLTVCTELWFVYTILTCSHRHIGHTFGSVALARFLIIQIT